MILKRPLFLIIFSLVLSASKAQITRQANWQQTVNYKIEVTLDDQNHILRGFETMEYINNSPNTLGEIYIHLWPNAYKNDKTAFARQMVENGETSFHFAKDKDRGYIDSLDFFINGSGTPWAFDINNPDIAKITLNNPLKPGDRCSISTPFLVKIPKVFSRLGHDGQTYNISQWYPKPAVYDINGWNPMPYLNQGEFYSEFGAFDVKITLPKNYIIAATGVLQDENEVLFRREKGKNTSVMENTYCKTPMKTVQFKQDSIHDFAWFASKNFGIRESSVLIGGKTIETFVYSQKDKDLEGNTDAIKTALIYYSENAGNYPYSHASVVKSELKAGGGMEYPMITVCDVLNREVIIHEVGHNWFYGILGNNERRYPWMDESINSYFESQAMKESEVSKTQTKKENFVDKASDFGLDVLALSASRVNMSQAVGLHSVYYTDLNYGTMVYGKGSFIFKHLRAYLGDDLFKKCFNTYYETWKFKHPLPGDMQKSFEDVSGKKLDWFFQTLINSDDKIDPKIVSADTKNGGIKIITNQKNMPIPIGIYRDTLRIGTHWTENGQLNLNGESGNFKNVKLLIDPDKVVFDINRKNNQYKTKGIMKRWPSSGIELLTRPDVNPRRELFILPVIGFNIHNGFLLGAGFHNWSIPLRKFEYMVMPVWGFSSQTLGGYANFNYKITPHKLFQSVDVGVNNASFAYNTQVVPDNSYFRTRAYTHFTLKPKSLRSKKSNKFWLEYTYVIANALNSENGSTNIELNNYGFARFTYIHENKRVIDPYSLKLTLERGGYKNTDTLYFKPGLELNFFKTYRKKNKGFSFRMFAGTFYSEGRFDNGLFMYRLGSKNGQFDYGMEQSLMGRGANSGLWSSHITPGDDNMKLKGTLGNFTKGFIVLNLSSNLPGKIPLRPYADLCFMQDELFTSNNKAQKFVYSGGIAIDIIPKMFMIYFPLVQSKVIEDVQNLQKINSFGQRICFTLILNDFEPHTFFRKVKLF